MTKTMIDTRGEYIAAYNWYLTAQGECPHWDYENPNGCGAQCCLDMVDAHNRVKQIRKKLTR